MAWPVVAAAALTPRQRLSTFEVGAWCAPAPKAYLLGLGAKLRWLGSRSQVVLATSVPNGARRRHSRAEAQVCARCVRSCGESSTRPLLIYFADLLFACGAQVTRASCTRSRSRTPSPTPQSDTRRPTFYLCEQSHTDFFGTRNCLVWVACLRVRGTTGGRACDPPAQPVYSRTSCRT